MNTTWEQLESAAVSLARSGAIKDRLAEAYRNHLALVNVEELESFAFTPGAFSSNGHGCSSSSSADQL